MTALSELLSFTPAPPFVRFTPDELARELRRILAVEPRPKLSLHLAMAEFLRQHPYRPLRSLLTALLTAVARATMTVPQRCDYHIAMWSLTGDPTHVWYVVDVARGRVPASPEAREIARWAVASIGGQCPAWELIVVALRGAALS